MAGSRPRLGLPRRKEEKMLRIVTMMIALTCPLVAQAGMFGDLVNSAKKATEETLDKVVDSVTSGEEGSQNNESTNDAQPQKQPTMVPETNDTVLDTVTNKSEAATSPASGAGKSPPGATNTIKSVEVDGVRLGLNIDEALKNLTAHGYDMKAPGPYSKLTGVTVEGRGTTLDGNGYVNVTIRQMGGIVYWYQKEVGYLINRIPDGESASSLTERFQKEIPGLFAGARYTETEWSGAIHFDDESQPPYARKITSPHARVVVNDRSGRVGYMLTIDWKEPVGANW